MASLRDRLFGFEIKPSIPAPELNVFSPKIDEDDGAAVVFEGGIQGTYVDLDGAIRTESELVNKYRDMAGHPEIDIAIDEIVNEAIVSDPNEKIVKLNLDDLNQPPKIKEMMFDAHERVMELLEFNKHAYEIFKKWYVDGRLNYHVIIDEQMPQMGIQEVRYLDPRKVRKIRSVKRTPIPNSTMSVTKDVDEFYVYNERGFAKSTAGFNSNGGDIGQSLKIAKDSIVTVTSGMTNPNGDMIVSYLNKAIKPLNQLKSMEDSLVIYRISRAPERRIFYIDVGNLPKIKAEQYLRDTMVKFKNKLVYDSSTGEIRDDRRFQTMLEDFWLPRRGDGKSTEITTLPGGQNLGQIDDIVYFQKNLYKSLNVPISRLDPDNTYNIGRATEISRDEVKFSKFIQRLRAKFSDLFAKLLEKQLILTGIITTDDWQMFKNYIKYEFTEDNHFSELRNSEILMNRLNTLEQIRPYVGTYFSNEYLRRKILFQDDDLMAQIDQQIMEELSNPQYNRPVGPDGEMVMPNGPAAAGIPDDDK